MSKPEVGGPGGHTLQKEAGRGKQNEKPTERGGLRLGYRGLIQLLVRGG